MRFKADGVNERMSRLGTSRRRVRWELVDASVPANWAPEADDSEGVSTGAETCITLKVGIL